MADYTNVNKRLRCWSVEWCAAKVWTRDRVGGSVLGCDLIVRVVAARYKLPVSGSGRLSGSGRVGGFGRSHPDADAMGSNH